MILVLDADLSYPLLHRDQDAEARAHVDLPRCRARFVTADASHSCGTHTLDDLLMGWIREAFVYGEQRHPAGLGSGWNGYLVHDWKCDLLLDNDINSDTMTP